MTDPYNQGVKTFDHLISFMFSNNFELVRLDPFQINLPKINSKIKPAKHKVVDCDGLLLIPGLINSHTHIGDSIAKDISLDKDPDSKINPIFGIKQKILRETEPKKLIHFMKKTMKPSIIFINLLRVKILYHQMNI